MIKLSQRDPKWASGILGKSKLTMGRYGCTTTCLSMLSDYFNMYLNPAEMSRKIKYTIDGLIIWASVYFPTFKFEKRVYGFKTEPIDISLKDPKKAVILQVQGNHWVVALGRIPLTNTYRIADPWFGDVSTTLRYKNQITGSAHFINPLR